MNEGKPTKAKWWSRPRASEDAPDGDFELERPRPAGPEGTAAGAAPDDRDADRDAEAGDFELERPMPPRATDAGDYELDRPLPDRNDPTDTPPRQRSGRDHDDVTGTAAEAGPHRPGGPVADPSVDAGGHRQTDADAQPPAHADRARQQDPDAGPAVDPGSQASPESGPAPVAERPKPLHEPDPYSTPPYGEPGPWAPAPPVQHPAATPAHGTVTAAPHAAAPHTPAVPASAAPVPAVPASAAPAPAPSPPPGAVPDPAFAETPPPVPHPGHPAAPAPAYDTASHAGAPPTATPPNTTPATPTPPDPAPVTDLWPGPATAAPGAEPGADPWGRYDPWAAAAARHHEAADRAPKRRGRRAARTLVGGALLIALISGGLGGAVGAYLERNGGMGTVELPQAVPEAAERAPDSVAGIAARALPSVVTLHVSGSEAAGTGTGFVLDDRGHILTNNHVVEPAGSGGEITVTFNSGDTAEATVVGRDSGYDLAVVKVKGVSGLTPMPLGNSDNVRVGDPVVAIGAPFDLAGTVTSGIISAKERPITAGGEEGDGSDVSYVDALQTDAPINPGNSGGPLLDGRGRAIGINSAIRSADSGSAESDGGQAGSIGLGFAIPINQGKRVAEELINTGKATHPVIGITLDMGYAGDGARVGAKGSEGGAAVTPGGPGAKAGIKPGDVITAVDGQRVHSGEELIVKTRAHRPGDRLELTLERDGEETKVSLVLGSAGGD
ncbi:trypsin-like peptidase domain-containing protein [Streptomyces sp. HUAS CX7]|uniref:trypsin-like peptidase domain-containing protein n=1 Tax=Streptomyces sp. HUAS CX7 TaxID=3062782 RepID=UPI0026EB392A|nr:trypsin-like peptidase domain-containing protein [Streptomyces sp. HUAS CX7]WKX18872.1 trypsin-like peptidase domain-containing protein [Streptomyces sp. HUAS CX7]